MPARRRWYEPRRRAPGSVSPGARRPSLSVLVVVEHLLPPAPAEKNPQHGVQPLPCRTIRSDEGRPSLEEEDEEVLNDVVCAIEPLHRGPRFFEKRGTEGNCDRTHGATVTVCGALHQVVEVFLELRIVGRARHFELRDVFRASIFVVHDVLTWFSVRGRSPPPRPAPRARHFELRDVFRASIFVVHDVLTWFSVRGRSPPGPPAPCVGAREGSCDVVTSSVTALRGVRGRLGRRREGRRRRWSRHRRRCGTVE